MKKYRFSPIQDEDALSNVFEYVAFELRKLSLKILNEALPITTLKIFPHYQEEYEYVYKLIYDMGEPAAFNSKTSFYTKASKQIDGNAIKYLGVRIVDSERPHVGCGDYEVNNFDEFRAKHAGKSDFIRDFRKDMLEIRHPDFDVLGYVIPAE